MSLSPVGENRQAGADLALAAYLIGRRTRRPGLPFLSGVGCMQHPKDVPRFLVGSTSSLSYMVKV